MFGEQTHRNISRLVGVCTAACLTVALSLVTTSANAETYSTFSIPETTTHPTGINEAGVITGYSVTSDFEVHGFVRDPDGTVTAFDPIGSLSTYPIAIDKKGSIAGRYVGDDTLNHGFMRNAKGKITPFDPPGSRSTIVTGFTNAVVGYAEIAHSEKGFLRFPDGTYSTFKYPGSHVTQPLAINKAGVVVGVSRHFGVTKQGFLRNPDGTIETIRVNGRVTPVAINLSGVILAVGHFGNVFVKEPDGMVTTIEIPDAVTIQPASINDKGVAVGYFIDLNAVTHGFLWTKARGATPFDVPDMNITTPTAINNDDVVIGTCVNNESGTQEYAFIRTP